MRSCQRCCNILPNHQQYVRFGVISYFHQQLLVFSLVNFSLPNGYRKWQPTPVFFPENSMDRGAWCATVHGVIKSWTQLSDWAHTYMHSCFVVCGINLYFSFLFYFCILWWILVLTIFFMCFLAICVSFLVKCLFKFFVHI